MAGLEPDKARATAGGKKAAVVREWHEPEVSSRDVCPVPVEVPGPALKLVKLAEASLVHSLALRLSRGAQRAAVAWEAPVGGAGKWTVKMRAVACRYVCQLSGRIDLGLTVLSDRELKAFLAERDPREGVTPAEMERAVEALRSLSS